MNNRVSQKLNLRNLSFQFCKTKTMIAFSGKKLFHAIPSMRSRIHQSEMVYFLFSSFIPPTYILCLLCSNPPFALIFQKCLALCKSIGKVLHKMSTTVLPWLQDAINCKMPHHFNSTLSWGVGSCHSKYTMIGKSTLTLETIGFGTFFRLLQSSGGQPTPGIPICDTFGGNCRWPRTKH